MIGEMLKSNNRLVEVNLSSEGGESKLIGRNWKKRGRMNEQITTLEMKEQK